MCLSPVFHQHDSVASIISFDAKRTRASATQIFDLETGVTALTNSVAIADTFCSGRGDAFDARTRIGYALGFVLTHRPPNVATRHLAFLTVFFGILYSARCTRHT